MNPIRRLRRWWRHRDCPRATEDLTRGTCVLYTSKEKTEVRRYPVRELVVPRCGMGIALEDARKGERVQIAERGIFNVPNSAIPKNNVYHTPDNPPKADENLPRVHFVDDDWFGH